MHRLVCYNDDNVCDFKVAKERVYRKEVASMNTEHEPGLPLGILPILEECPKWRLLADIMEEIELELNSSLTEGNRWIFWECIA